MNPKLLLLLTGGTLFAQSTVDRPMIGWVWSEAAQLLRPVFGIPGSSVLGPPVRAPYSSIKIASHGNWAVAVAADRRPALIDLRGGDFLAQFTAPVDVDETAISPE